jgi:hypothetical protein
MSEFVNYIIDFINKTPEITALATVVTIFGTSVLGLLGLLFNNYLARRHLGRDNIQLSREIADKQNTIREYEKLIAWHNSEMDDMLQILPVSEKAAHILMHELSELGRFPLELENIKKRTAKHHRIEPYGNEPVILNYVRASATLIARRKLVSSYKCARMIVAEDFYEKYDGDLYLQIIGMYGSGDVSSLSVQRHMMDLDELDVLEDICIKLKDYYPLDMILATKLRIVMNERISIPIEMRRSIVLKSLNHMRSADVRIGPEETHETLKNLYEEHSRSFKILNQIRGVFAEKLGVEDAVMKELLEDKALHATFVETMGRHAASDFNSHSDGV